MGRLPRSVRATQTIACVMIRDFAIQNTYHEYPELAGVPLVLVQYGKIKGKVAAVSKEAEPLGIIPGLAISRARGIAPTSHFLTLDQSAQDAAVLALLERLWTFTNRIEVDPDALPQTFVAYLDLGRISEAEREIIRDGLMTQLQQTTYTGTVAFAASKLPASVAAVQGVEQVASGQEAAFIADAPLTVLSPSKEIEQHLQRLYIRTVGEFAALPRAAIAGQFGRAGVRLHQLANGLDGRPVKPHQMPAVELISHDLDFAPTRRDQVDGVVASLSERLAERLEKRCAALHEIALTLHFAGDKQRVERLHLLQPVSTAESLRHTLKQLIDRRVLTQAITRIDVRLAHLVSAMPRQLELFTDQPQRHTLLNLVEVLSRQHGHCFYQPTLAETQSLLPEERFQLHQVIG